MVAYTYNPATWRLRQEGIQIDIRLSNIVRPISKNKKQKVGKWAGNELTRAKDIGVFNFCALDYICGHLGPLFTHLRAAASLPTLDAAL